MRERERERERETLIPKPQTLKTRIPCIDPASLKRGTTRASRKPQRESLYGVVCGVREAEREGEGEKERGRGRERGRARERKRGGRGRERKRGRKGLYGVVREVREAVG